MLGATDTAQIVTWVAVLVGGGGITASIVAFIKAPKEAGNLVIKAAEGAVIVQSGVIEDLREQLAAQSGRIELLERDKQAAMWEAGPGLVSIDRISADGSFTWSAENDAVTGLFARAMQRRGYEMGPLGQEGTDFGGQRVLESIGG